MTLSTTQLETRSHGIGSSDAAASIGVCPFKTPLQLYLEKIGEIEPDDLSDVEVVQWGNRLENEIAKAYCDRLGVKVRNVNRTQVHSEHPFMIGHVDRLVVGARRILECKNVNHFYGAKAFGDEYTDEVPANYLAQVNHLMIVNDINDTDLAALIGGNRLKVYRFNLDFELAEVIIQRETEFWNRVINRDPPPPHTVDDLSLLYDQDSGLIKEIDSEIVALWERARDLKNQEKFIGNECEEACNKLKLAIAESAGISFAGKVLATYKSQTARRLDQTAFKTDHPDLFEQYRKENSYRILRIKQ